MFAREKAESLDSLIREILVVAGERKRSLASHHTENSLGVFTQRDYSSALRNQFDRQQLTDILNELTTALPTLNKKVFAILSLERLSTIANELGAVLQARPYSGAKGRSLRGFYVSDPDLLAGPLIWVNTAVHPVGVAAAFWHEVGHHLVRRIFDNDHTRTGFTFKTNYEEHLNEPEEIAADMLMVLACYPQPAARQLFMPSGSINLNRDANRLVSRVRPYIRTVTGWDFEKKNSAKESLHQLAGMIHAAKLRETLLREYHI